MLPAGILARTVSYRLPGSGVKIEYVPLLAIQRQLYAIPRGRERFEAYLRAMTTPERDDLTLAPLAGMNPMGKDHIPALLDRYLALDAEGIARQAAEETAARLPDAPLERKIGLVVVDDLMGGWTNRYTTEFGLSFGGRLVATAPSEPPADGAQTAASDPPHRSAPPKRRRYREWLSAVLWTSETPSAQRVRVAAQLPIHRAAYMERHGAPRTLGDFLAQEGEVMASSSGCAEPSLDADDLAYTRQVLAPLLGAEDWPTIIACAYGDAAARELGYRPHGLSDRAGLALALHDAREKRADYGRPTGGPGDDGCC